MESTKAMILKKTSIRLVGLPVLIGMVTTPVFAMTPDPMRAGPATVSEAMQIELVYPRYAQVGGDEIGGSNAAEGDNDNRRVAPAGPVVPASTAQTTQIVTQLDQIQRICEFMGDEYRIACFATTYRDLADDIPVNGDYAETREVLLEAARELDDLVRSNIDRSKPALQARTTNSSGQSVQTPPMRAVQASQAPQLNRRASNIIEEAETVLLRSASSDATRAIHYQRIAAAVGSNKVLLRSG